MPPRAAPGRSRPAGSRCAAGRAHAAAGTARRTAEGAAARRRRSRPRMPCLGSGSPYRAARSARPVAAPPSGVPPADTPVAGAADDGWRSRVRHRHLHARRPAPESRSRAAATALPPARGRWPAKSRALPAVAALRHEQSEGWMRRLAARRCAPTVPWSASFDGGNERARHAPGAARDDSTTRQ